MESYNDIQLEINQVVKNEMDSLYSVYGLKRMDMLKAKLLLSLLTRVFLLKESRNVEFWKEMVNQIGTIDKYYLVQDKEDKVKLLNDFISIVFDKMKVSELGVNPLDYFSKGDEVGKTLSDFFDDNKEMVLKYLEIINKTIDRIIKSLENGK